MRSIGKIKIRKLRAMVRAEAQKWVPLSMNAFQCKEELMRQVPEEYLDTWESAWAEINRIIDDELSAIMYGPRS